MRKYYSANLKDTDYQATIQSAVDLAAYVCNADASAMLFSDEGRDWLSGTGTFEATEQQLPEQISAMEDVLEVSEPASAESVTNKAGKPRPFIAAVPVYTSEKLYLGSLVVKGYEHTCLEPKQKSALKLLAKQMAVQIQIIKKNTTLETEAKTQSEYKALFESARELDIILEPDGTISYVNLAIEEILGYHHQSLIGRNIHELELWKSRDIIKNTVQPSVENGQKRIKFSCEVKTKSGDIKWISWAIVVQDNYWLMSGRDITSRRRTELDYGDLWMAKNLGQGVSISDLNGNIIWVNDAYTRLTGFTIQEVTGQRTGDVLSGKGTDMDVIKEARAKASAGEPCSVEFLSYRKSGQSFWLSVSSTVTHPDENGQPRLIEILTDISEKKAKQLELETLSLVARKSSLGVFIRDGEGQIVWMNEALEQMCGYTMQELEGQDLRSLCIGEKTDMKILKALWTKIENNEPYEAELVFYRKDGTPFWVFIATSMIFDNAGNLERTVSLILDITARKKTEAELKRLSMIVKKSSNAIAFRDLNGKITWVNEAYEGLLGYSHAEIAGTNNFEQLIGPETDLKQVALIEKKIRAGKGGNIQLTLYRKDGRAVTGIASVNPINNEDGTIDSIATIITDISELQEKEKEIRKLSFVATQSPNGVIIRDENDLVLWVNPAFEEIFGYTQDELAGRDVSQLFLGPETDLKVFQNTVKSRLRRKKHSAELLYYRKDRSPVWVHLQNYPVISSKGQVESSVTTLTDITERKQKEEQLLTLSMVASKTGTGVIINDRSGNVFWVNPAFEEITGYSLREMSGHMAGDVLSGPETDMKKLRKTRHTAKSKKPYYAELRAYKKDGTPFWAAISGTPVVDEYGRLNKEIEILEDITNRKDAELELIRTREEALNLGKVKEMFLSVMSHEIRTPLNSILGMAQLLLDENPEESQLKWLNLLKFSGENLRTLINDILDLTKMETGNLTLEKAALDVHDLLSKTITSLQLRAHENSTKLSLEKDANVPTLIKGDSVRLYQILMNLIGNAIKFTKNGKVTVKVTAIKETASTVQIRFKVSDTGIGIPKNRLDAIFEPYTQASDDTTRKFGGTGLGLTIVKNLLKIHGSEIHVTSKIGKGTTFSFDITFEKVVSTQSGIQETLPATLSVLVVDDEELNRRIAEKILRGWNFDVHLAENGKIAVEKVQSRKFDCILMDLNMPVMNGIEATSIIRSLADADFGLATLPILALTASSDAADLELIEASGMSGHIVKPFRKEHLLTEIKRLVGEMVTP